MNDSSPLLVVTPGEPAGVGPEITLKLARDHPELNLLAVADPDCLRRTARGMEIEVEPVEWSPGMATRPGVLACLPVGLAVSEKPGVPDVRNSPYVLNCLREAVLLVQQGNADALITGPVHKAVINDAGIAFSGHTEFLANLSGASQVVMMLVGNGLRVALVTTHLPLRQVADAITAEKLEGVIRITERSLRENFGIAHPRLQVLGLNPHAGERGHLGAEDSTIIRPAIERCRSGGADIQGPVPADTAFTPPRLAACDAVIAMYHDQGLPVLKHFAFGQAVNVTLGLPFIRTSVDHGTALDIAGKGEAQAGSLYQAAALGAELAKRRAATGTRRQTDE